MASHATPAHGAFDELDPHGMGHHGQHASHVIVGPFTLRSVLVLLLFFTLLTVGQAQLEVYLSHALDIEFPKWINVVFCMSIAVVKALLVMAYFMQLRYDNPINSVVMAFTFFALALFLGFTSLDLSQRGSVYAWKTPTPISGGAPETAKKAADNAVSAWGNEKYEKIKHVIKHDHPAHAGMESSPQRSRAATGLSGALDAAAHSEHAPAAEPAHGDAAPKAPAH